MRVAKGILRSNFIRFFGSAEVPRSVRKRLSVRLRTPLCGCEQRSHGMSPDEIRVSFRIYPRRSAITMTTGEQQMLTTANFDRTTSNFTIAEVRLGHLPSTPL